MRTMRRNTTSRATRSFRLDPPGASELGVPRWYPARVAGQGTVGSAYAEAQIAAATRRASLPTPRRAREDGQTLSHRALTTLWSRPNLESQHAEDRQLGSRSASKSGEQQAVHWRLAASTKRRCDARRVCGRSVVQWRSSRPPCSIRRRAPRQRFLLRQPVAHHRARPHRSRTLRQRADDIASPQVPRRSFTIPVTPTDERRQR